MSKVDPSIGPAADNALEEENVVLLGVPDAELTPNVRAALLSMLSELQLARRELSERQDEIRKLEALADRDALTDIFNRRAFARELDRVIAMVQRYEMRASLIFIDLNDLKNINDTRGHHAGDAALVHIANTIRANIRQGDSFGRLGGDEFAVILLQAGETVARKKADDLADAVAARTVQDGEDSFHISISTGAIEVGPGFSSRRALEEADRKMYAAKQARRKPDGRR